MIRRLLTLFLACFALLAPASLAADPADVSAAARGVVRVVVLAEEDGTRYPISHGSGFAVTRDSIVTNAHVVEEVRNDPNLRLAVIPPEGGDPVFGAIVAFSPRNDLALVKLSPNPGLPPLTIAGTPSGDNAEVSAVGYPMSVDMAQGLEMGDIFRPQPPVKARGFLSGQRPSREFDTILHTAPIARGNSGGPLLDSCGRVVGVNSFGTDTSGGDAEFFFAISNRELLPFLRESGIAPRVIGQPCRSLAELDANERAEATRQEMLARQEQAAEQVRLNEARETAERTALLQIISERENGMALALLCLIGGLAASGAAWMGRKAGDERQMMVAGTIAGAGLIIAAVAWFSRPPLDSIDARAQQIVADARGEAAQDNQGPANAGVGKLVCTIQQDRSRITSADIEDLPLEWKADGCVNNRTQYGLADNRWSRVFVPNDEQVVSVNSYDPARSEYRIERYLLSRQRITAARTERGKYRAPNCGGGDSSALKLGQDQAAVLAQLPPQPNERLVYRCTPANDG